MLPSRLTVGRSHSRTVFAEKARSRGRAVEPVPCCAATVAARLIPSRPRTVLFQTSVVSTVVSFLSPKRGGNGPPVRGGSTSTHGRQPSRQIRNTAGRLPSRCGREARQSDG